MISLFKLTALAGLVAIASGQGGQDTFVTDEQAYEDFCGCRKENLRKVTICRIMAVGGGTFGPGVDNRFFGFEYNMDYNITDINVRVSLTHPVGSDIKGKLYQKESQSGNDIVSPVTLFHIADNINSTTFEKVTFDADSANEIPATPTTNLVVPEGFYKPTDDDLDTTFLDRSTKGYWALEMIDENAEDPAEAAGRLTEFCIIITTNTPTDVQGEADRRRQLKDEALKVRMEAAIEKQNRGREF